MKTFISGRVQEALKGVPVAFYSSASNASLWRGIHYYKEEKVESHSIVEEGIVRGVVSGSEGNIYDTTINLNHPKKSTCSCPFADGRKVVCKHMIALYFTSVPGSYEALEKDLEQEEAHYELQEERWREETYRHIKAYVAKLSAKDARERLVNSLYQDALDDRYRKNDYW